MFEGKTKSGIKWSFVESITITITQLLFNIILVRLLTPQDYGVLGICMAFIVLSRSIIEGGFYQALIQKEIVEKEDYDTVLRFNVLVSLLLFILINAFSNLISEFYQIDKVKEVLFTLTIVIIFESFIVSQKAYLVKMIKFNILAKIMVFSKTTAGIVGIGLAFAGYGVWSLVVKELVGSLIMVILFWYWTENKGSLNGKVNFNRLKNLLRFGGRIFIADQIESFSNEIASLIVGKRYSVNLLGLYDRAFQLSTMTSQTIVVAINKVAYPTLSNLQSNHNALRENYKKFINLTYTLLTPILIIAITQSDLIIETLYGEKWLTSSQYFQLLCYAGFVYPITVINLNILKVVNRPQYYLKLVIITKGILVPAILIGSYFSIAGIVYAIIISKTIGALINAIACGKFINYGLLEQLRDVRFFFLFSVITIPTIFYLNSMIGINYKYYTATISTFMLGLIYIILIRSKRSSNTEITRK